MRRIVLIAAALVLVSASAQAGQSRNLSVAGSSSRPIALPLPPEKVAEAPTAATQSAPAAVTPAPAVAAPPAPPAPPPPVAAASTAPPAAAAACRSGRARCARAAPATDTPKYVERPPVAPVTSDTPKVDDGKPARRAERRHRGGGGYWTAGRIMGELRRYGYGYGYGGW